MLTASLLAVLNRVYNVIVIVIVTCFSIIPLTDTFESNEIDLKKYSHPSIHQLNPNLLGLNSINDKNVTRRVISFHDLVEISSFITNIGSKIITVIIVI